MTNGELIKLYETLNRLTDDHTQKFNVVLGYLLNKNKLAVRQEAALVYDARYKLMLDYGTLQDNGDIIIPKEKAEEVQKKLKELMELENDVKIFPIFNTAFDCQLNMEDIEGLMPILQEAVMTGLPIIE